MPNFTESLVHGHINYTHNSTLTSYYPTANLPTPWPLLVISVLISLLVSCLNVPAAFNSLKTLNEGIRNHPRSPWSRNKAHPAHQTELESLHKKANPEPPPYSSFAIANDSLFDIPTNEDIPLPIHEEGSFEPLSPPQATTPSSADAWSVSPTRKILDIVVITYSTYRAATAFTIQLLGLVDKKTPSAAPSNLLLILVSIQILLSNLSFPRLIRFILTSDVLLIAIAFTIASYAPLKNPRNDSFAPLNASSTSYPAYGQLNMTGGNCAVYASNCFMQTMHWINVGCGHYSQLQGTYTDERNPSRGFFSPYATSGSVNTSMNPLNILEAVIMIFGTIFLLSSAYQVYEIRYIVKPRSPHKQSSKRGSCTGLLFGMVVLFGVMGAFVASFMSIGAHMSQTLGKHHSIFLDSFGPKVSTNLTWGKDSYGTNVTIGTDYWGNSSSWSDCFVVENPRSADGRWAEYLHAYRLRDYGVRRAVQLPPFASQQTARDTQFSRVYPGKLMNGF